MIKYRQPIYNRDGSFKEWHYWGINIEQGGEIANVGFLTRNLGITDPADSQQFTEEFDLQGREMYYGDILSLDVYDGEKWVSVDTILCEKNRLKINTSLHYGFTVIGNIIEHPQLYELCKRT